MTQNTMLKQVFDDIAEYVEARKGTRVIRKILIANNGLAAVKGIRSMRKWAIETFNNASVLKFVVMATPEDIQSNAEYIRLADEMVQVPGEGNFNNYANVKLIVDTAERTQCDAVWPGWGHASENPELPETLSKTKSKIVFIGPGAIAMDVLGDKISSSILAETAGVPTMPWSGSGLRCETHDKGDGSVHISEELYEKACIKDEESALQKAAQIGYPLMIKASEGGGGKGIRKVSNDDELKLGYAQVKAEVPGSPIFLMKLASQSRHLEVQIVADQYGNAVALYSRDCSVQRRHQKIIEEGPVTIAPRSMVEDMEKAAVRLTKSVRYCGAGTVEYLFDSGKYYFLELNPRLQVEHPVSEWITGTNIPAIQLNIAMGVPLDMIPDIRRFFGRDPYGVDPIDFDKSKPLPPDGHVIACRITAENPEEGFQPTCGAVQELSFRNSTNVWGYFSIRPQGAIHAFSDSQFGHIFAHGPTREDARKAMVTALADLQIRGDISTTAEYLQTLINLDDYMSNNFTTAWLDGLIAKKIQLKKPDTFLIILCGALHTLHSLSSENIEKWMLCMERGQQPTPDLLQVTFPVTLIYDNVKYCMTGTMSGHNRFTLFMNGSFMEGEIKVLRDGGLLVVTESGQTHITYATKEPNGLRISVDGKSCLFTKEFDPSQIRTNATGKLVRYLVNNGTHVVAKTPIAELEVMKMIITMYAPLSGRIQLQLVEGTTVNQGDVIAKLDLDDKTQIKSAVLYEGKFPEKTSSNSLLPHQLLDNAINLANTILSGYDFPDRLFELKLTQLLSGLKLLSDSSILVHKFVNQMSVLRKAIPNSLFREAHALLEEKFYGTYQSPQIMEELVKLFKQCEDQLQGSKKVEFSNAIKPLLEISRLHASGYKEYATQILSQLLDNYLSVEKFFDKGRRQESIWLQLREKYRDDLPKTFKIGLSQSRVPKKNKIICGILDEIERLDIVSEFMSPLNDLSSLLNRCYSDVVLKAKQILMKARLPSMQKMTLEMEKIFLSAVDIQEPKQRTEVLKDIISRSNYSFDVLLQFLSHSNSRVRDIAAEVYIRKAYCTFDVQILNHTEHKFYKTVQFRFLNADSSLTSPTLSRTDGIVGSISFDNLASMPQMDTLAHTESEDNIGFGVMSIFNSLSDIQNHLDSVLKTFDANDDAEHTNVLKIFLNWPSNNTPNDQEILKELTAILRDRSAQLNKYDVKRVTVVIDTKGQLPFYFTFRQRMDYAEDPMYRHIEPTLAFQLFLRKMNNYDVQPVPCNDPSVHIYFASAKKKLKVPAKYDYLHKRFFVRTLVLSGDIFTQENPEEFQITAAERCVVDSLNALELAMADSRYPSTFANHIFINFLPEIVVGQTDIIKEIINKFQNNYASRLWNLRVTEVEVKLNIKTSPLSPVTPLRFVATNKTGYNLLVDIYQELKDPNTGKIKYSTLMGKQDNLHGQDINAPHPLLQDEQIKRRLAHNNDTSYVYDYPYLFERMLKQAWKEYASERKLDGNSIIPKNFFAAKELVLNKQGQLEQLQDGQVRETAIGMVAWRMILKTPEFPDGRDIIVIANDITYQSGSFGPLEDELFQKASELSRREKLPRIYIAANSGARIGLATEVQEVFKVEWNDPDEPSKGFKYFYVSEKDYEALKRTNSINAQLIEENGERRWKIIDIIGKSHGIGVENLRGSGMIAGETSRAYEEVFTLNYVAARSVGIGAYLNRLGQRIIQNRKAPILLTGASALNKVLSKEVYSSNLQLGGTQIMYPNGVTHLICRDDQRAIRKILQWLSYVPRYAGGPLPILKPFDPIDREIECVPRSDLAVEIRSMLAGEFIENPNDPLGEKLWKSGLLDKDSFFETLGGWAKSIVVGRGRLGGIPLGVLAVDTRSVEQIIPADPADSTSRERVIHKSGQVWFPDSAYKTAQAIRDFNFGEELPLLVLANWRGFSGGQRDMFDEILKFGSFIVDALKDYRKPVFVYIVPNGELRGGAWVVIDPMINPQVMEMYADEHSRGSVLEPSGVVEIKYRKKDIIDTIHRLDKKYIQLAKDLARQDLNHEQKLDIQKQMEKRTQLLIPVYTHVAIQFADLHDTPGRMKAKGVISNTVNWSHARKFFYLRLKRKLAEFDIYAQIANVNRELTHVQRVNILKEWVRQSQANGNSMDDNTFSQLWNDDARILAWIEQHAHEIEKHHLKTLHQKQIERDVVAICNSDLETALDAMINHLKTNVTEPVQRAQLLEKLKKEINSLSL